jgi:NAD(P)-dependent dehydrogenase (short-subunit alcohol dehydrogenase family)
VLINNAGIAIYDDLSHPEVIEQHMAVNVFGTLKVTRAFLPQLVRAKGAIVNNLSLAAIASLPMIPAYSISKAAGSNMTQSLRSLLKSQGVTVHGVFLGPIDTDMTAALRFRRPRRPRQRKASSTVWRKARRTSSPIQHPFPRLRAGAPVSPRGWSGNSRPSCRRPWPD